LSSECVSSKETNVLNKYHKKLGEQPGFLSLGFSTKFVGGKSTGEQSITIFVKKKLPLSQLKATNIEPIPKELDGIKTDVVELSALDYEIGETSVSKKSPSEQTRIVNGVKAPC
jgi:hypothetical protein